MTRGGLQASQRPPGGIPGKSESEHHPGSRRVSEHCHVGSRGQRGTVMKSKRPLAIDAQCQFRTYAVQQTTGTGRLFGHLVGAGDQRRRDFQAERHCGLETAAEPKRLIRAWTRGPRLRPVDRS